MGELSRGGRCRRTGGGEGFWGLSDEDMIRCQSALPEPERDEERVRILTEGLRRATDG